MSATYSVVTIGDYEFEVYADLATAEQYLAADPKTTKWDAASDDQKGKWLVKATRILNGLGWPGEKTDAGQALAWPRKSTGLDDVDDATIPQGVIDAACELANALANGWDAERTSTANQVRRRKAGPVEVEYFAPSDFDALPLPKSVWDLISALFGSSSASSFASSESTGTCGASAFSTGYAPSRPL